MKKAVSLIVCILVLSVSIPAAYATDQKKPDYNGHFGNIDTDKNGQVNWDEFKQYFPHAEENIFKTADGNTNGSIDHDEWHKFKKAQGYSHAQ